MENEIEKMQNNWNILAVNNPMWAIDASKEEWNEKEFYSMGRGIVSELLKDVKYNPGFVLDFGCGIGRLSKHLDKIFKNVYGIDISEQMIKIASKNIKGVAFFNLDELDKFDTAKFDVIVSYLVFQHIPQVITKQYIRELLGMLEPDGLFIFQQIDNVVGLESRSLGGQKKYGASYNMYGIAEEEIRELVKGYTLEKVVKSVMSSWSNKIYYVRNK